MASKTKLLLIPCSGKETAELTKDIFTSLKKDYGLEDQVEVLWSVRRLKIPPGTPKGHRHDLVTDYFPDKEVQVDLGRNDLKDIIQGKHIALVEHLLTPCREVSVNDHLMTIRGILNVVGKVETPKRTLVTPYLSYVRSHSVEKYEKIGFYQFDSLREILKDFQRDGLRALVTIDSHSHKAEEISQQLDMEFHEVNPFQSGRAINPAKLGFSSDKAEEITRRLRPYQERFNLLKKENPDHLYIVSVDDGTERRAENFVERAFPDLSPLKVYSRLVYFDKKRTSYDETAFEFKPFSIIYPGNFDLVGTYIIIDDMFSSGGTAAKVAQILKKLGAARVEVWVSHAVTMPEQLETANDRSYIDQVVSLDTVPQHQDLKIEQVKASADLLAAELYKAHQKLIASG